MRPRGRRTYDADTLGECEVAVFFGDESIVIDDSQHPHDAQLVHPGEDVRALLDALRWSVGKVYGDTYVTTTTSGTSVEIDVADGGLIYDLCCWVGEREYRLTRRGRDALVSDLRAWLGAVLPEDVLSTITDRGSFAAALVTRA